MWRPDQLLGEARRNLGPAHLGLGILLTAVLTGVLGYTVIAAQQALQQEQDRHAAGSHVWIATPVEAERPLDGAACTNLGGWPGVAATGGVAASANEPVYAFAGGRSPVPLVGLTPGALQVFAPAAPAGTVTLGADLYALGSAAPNQWLLDSGGNRALRPTIVITSAPVGLLTSSVTTTVLADTPISACWIRMQPGAVQSGADVLGFAYPSDRAFIAPFLGDAAGVLTPLQQWRAAMSVQPWALGAAIIALAVLLLTWTRRAEIAVYRTFGTSRASVAAIIAGELAMIAIPAAAAAILLLAITTAARWGELPNQVLAIALTQAVAATVTGLAVSTAAALLFTRGDITQALRDR
ncbi:FtsX-like permease family protein [Occultella gossypii]|uniref:ABC transporter permease n=1 Tax=Occultella gossypii TaxID=2800820 RepID=A0ABS7SH72_9MICO|nr:FtsX-like permease family protein [Occultella gossypii]MBZ2199711.1 hypothetical protein [Occultella gossypii]